MEYSEWEPTVALQIQREARWKFFGYRKALFLYELSWQDCEEFRKNPLGKAVAE